MSTISEIQIMHAERNGVRAPYLMDGDDVCDFYTYSENEHGQKVGILPFPDAEEKARFSAAAWNTIHRIASRLGVDPLKLAESGAVERIVAEADGFAAYYAGNKLAHLGNGKAMKTCVAMREAIAACRQTEEGK